MICPRCEYEVNRVPGAYFYCPANNSSELCEMTKMPDTTEELLNERAKTHGDYALHAALTQDLKIALHGAPNWPTLNAMQREALEMIVHKIGRVLAGKPDFKDHWDDIAGYAKLVADRCPA